MQLQSKGLETIKKLTRVGGLIIPGVFTREKVNLPGRVALACREGKLPCKHNEEKNNECVTAEWVICLLGTNPHARATLSPCKHALKIYLHCRCDIFCTCEKLKIKLQ